MRILIARSVRKSIIMVGILFVSSCATGNSVDELGQRTPQWAANGYLTPGPSSEPEIIGLYLTKNACEKAIDDWLSRQVVGNPISGECLPIDSH